MAPKAIEPVAVGKYLAKHVDRIVDDFRLRQRTNRRGISEYLVERHGLRPTASVEAQGDLYRG